MDDTETTETVETDAGPTRSSMLEEALSAVTEEGLDAAFARYSSPDPDVEAVEAEPTPSADVREAWEAAVDGDPRLAEIVSDPANANLFKTGTPLSMGGIEVAQALVAHDDEELEAIEAGTEAMFESALDALVTTDDDGSVMGLLDGLADQVGLEDPRFADFYREAEEIAPGATLAWVSQRHNALTAEAAARQAAEVSRGQAIIDSVLALVAQKEKSTPQFQTRIAPRMEALLANVQPAKDADDARATVETAYRAALELDRVERLDEWGDKFLETALAHVPSARDENGDLPLEKLRAQVPPTEGDRRVLEKPASRAERLAQFADTFDSIFSPSAKLRAEVDTAAMRAEARAERKKSRDAARQGHDIAGVRKGR